MNGQPWKLEPGDEVTIYQDGLPRASGTVQYGWLSVHGHARVRLEFLQKHRMRLVPRRNRNPYTLGEIL